MVIIWCVFKVVFVGASNLNHKYLSCPGGTLYPLAPSPSLSLAKSASVHTLCVSPILSEEDTATTKSLLWAVAVWKLPHIRNCSTPGAVSVTAVQPVGALRWREYRSFTVPLLLTVMELVVVVVLPLISIPKS